MDIIIFITVMTVKLALSLLQIMMFARAILSFLPIDSSGKVTMFLTALTEPVIYPVRVIFDKLNIGTSIPIDIPFFVTFLILSFLSAII